MSNRSRFTEPTVAAGLKLMPADQRAVYAQLYADVLRAAPKLTASILSEWLATDADAKHVGRRLLDLEAEVERLRALLAAEDALVGDR